MLLGRDNLMRGGFVETTNSTVVPAGKKYYLYYLAQPFAAMSTFNVRKMHIV